MKRAKNIVLLLIWLFTGVLVMLTVISFATYQKKEPEMVTTYEVLKLTGAPLKPPQSSEVLKRPARYGFTNKEIYLMAQLLCGDKDTDGDGEYDVDFRDSSNLNHYEISKVFCVVMNRVRDPRFPNNITDVILAKNQFSTMPQNSYKTPSKQALSITRDWCSAYDDYDSSVQVIPINHIYFTGNGFINKTRP